MPDMHEGLAPVAWLLGTWKGGGKGIYPTIDDFTYEEELHFWHSGKPVMAYTSRTWSPEDGRAFHSEMGYWRPQQDGSVEVVVAHSFGLTEILTGTLSRDRAELTSVSFEGTPTAKMVEGEERVMWLEDGRLRYEQGMAFGDNVMQNHLVATLERVPS